jgi:hypothetical protein
MEFQMSHPGSRAAGSLISANFSNLLSRLELLLPHKIDPRAASSSSKMVQGKYQKERIEGNVVCGTARNLFSMKTSGREA